MVKKIRRVLGLNLGHDGGCSLCVEGEIVATMAEERLIGVKHAYGWWNSLNYCLEKSGYNLSKIDLIVFSDYSDKIRDGFDGGLSLFGFPKEKCIRVDHHLSHACSTFFTSPFEKALIFVFDARGNNNNTESVYVAENTNLTKIAGNPIPNYEKGIVAAYQAFTSYFGWHQNEAGKTMGLSSYGDAKKFSQYKIFSRNGDGVFSNNLSNHNAFGVEEFCKRNNLDVPPKFDARPIEYKDMAAWIQKEFEEAVIGIVRKFQETTGLEDLCMAGGGALNTACNTKILKNTKIKRLHIFPAAGDSGQSIGNTLYGYYVFGRSSRGALHGWSNDYRKFGYESIGVENLLKTISRISNLIIPKSPTYSFKRVPNVAKLAARLIADGKIIGWFQGGSEIGPRALGHRSILCDARSNFMKDVLNESVKHRESFRPFACSILLSQMGDYFELDRPSPFMMLVAPVKRNKRDKIPAVTHVDGTCRLQTVTRGENDIYYDLVNEFYKITRVPLVLNTSFNLAEEPIVETPADALRCFLKTEMDYLIIGDFLVEKALN